MKAQVFDLNEALRRKEAGLETASLNNVDMLAEARVIARNIASARPDRKVTMDAVNFVINARYGDEGISRLGNSAGSVFSGDEWVTDGKTIRSTRAASHGRRILVWRLV